MTLLLLLVILATSAMGAFAEDWTTTDGIKYDNIHVIRVEDDAITIIYKEGGALIPLCKLTPELQQKFSYDPVKAKIAADARAQSDTQNGKALQAEVDLATKLKKAQQIKDAQVSANSAGK